MSDKKIKIGITQGDTNGVGWELILAIFADSRMCEICTPIIYGSKDAGEFYKKLFGEEAENVKFKIIDSASEAANGKLNLVDCGTPKGQITPGEPSPNAGRAAIEALTRATQELKAASIDALVTSPFNKETVQGEDFSFPGHTEFIASHFEGENMMMMCSDLLKVGLVTKHVPLDQVANMLSEELIIKSAKALRKSLIEDFAVREPRIAVLSLNPHAGDGGLLGNEEQTIIRPAIEKAYAENILAFGPFPADGFFAAASYKNYDAVLAIYHDQGLIPFKTLTPEGVNFTAGLTAVRTSPDHGVAYDIAGRAIANTESMRNAIYMAIDVVRSRKTYKEITANPLIHIELERDRSEPSGERTFPRRTNTNFPPRNGGAPRHENKKQEK